MTLERGEPFVSEYTLDADPFGRFEPELFKVTVIRRSEDLWSVTRFGNNYWWDGTDWDDRPYDGMKEDIKDWQARHRWPLEEALEHAKVAIKAMFINNMTYDDFVKICEERELRN
jgi:hypothetical protein